jgi:ABC-type nickel/cobalt efflux system permease component RcnA
MKRKVIAGILVMLLGFSILGGIARRGAAMRMMAYNQQNAAQVESAETTDSTTTQQYDRHHVHDLRGNGRFPSPFSFLSIIPRLLVLGLGGWLLFKFLRRRRDNQDSPSGKIVDDLEDEITLNPDANATDEAEAPSAIDDLTVEDLRKAMNRLGINKLEL